MGSLTAGNELCETSEERERQTCKLKYFIFSHSDCHWTTESVGSQNCIRCTGRQQRWGNFYAVHCSASLYSMPHLLVFLWYVTSLHLPAQGALSSTCACGFPVRGLAHILLLMRLSGGDDMDAAPSKGPSCPQETWQLWKKIPAGLCRFE